MVAHGEDIEEALGGVFVAAVAGVDDGAADGAGEEVGGAGELMADDDHVDAHGFDVAGGVAEGFALGDAAGGDDQSSE